MNFFCVRNQSDKNNTCHSKSKQKKVYINFYKHFFVRLTKRRAYKIQHLWRRLSGFCVTGFSMCITLGKKVKNYELHRQIYTHTHKTLIQLYSKYIPHFYLFIVSMIHINLFDMVCCDWSTSILFLLKKTFLFS